MITQVRQLIKARDLIWAWTARTLRGRYQQSVLGWFWAIVQFDHGAPRIRHERQCRAGLRILVDRAFDLHGYRLILAGGMYCKPHGTRVG